MGSIGPGELIIFALVFVPIFVVFVGGPFAAGYFLGKSRGRRQAMLERLPGYASVPGAMSTPAPRLRTAEPGYEPPRA